MIRRLLSVVVFLFLIAGTIEAQKVSGNDLFAWVQGIEGRSPEGRREFVKKELKKLGVEFRTIPFDTTLGQGERARRVSGENVIVRLGKGLKHIVVGAHLDAVPNSPGANDNGGGVAVVLGLIKAMKNHPWNFSIDFCFFDQEEVGLIGSTFYVKRYKERGNHLAMINLDVQGTGEEVYVGPVGGGDDDRIMPIVREAARKTGFPFQAREFYPPSDWGSFADAKLENISISVVPKGDADLLGQAVRNQWKIDSTKVPHVMKVMHTPEDKSVHVSPKALSMSFEFTRTVLLLLNQSKN